MQNVLETHERAEEKEEEVVEEEKEEEEKRLGRSVGREQEKVRWLVSCDIYAIEPELNQLILIVIEMILAWIQRYYRRIHAH